MFHCKPNVMPPIIYPTNHCQTHTFSKTIVPHIHPQHTTNVNHQHFKHVHQYPHTYSSYCPVTHSHMHCGKPCCN
ncbi:CotD family spore coat protein [Bacillus licheniformis]|uniref:CotD family spore coat protein n=1 Tax=Bacillus licheniformis TaxID=1402 RepID=UPI000936DDDA|nr:CotD family spore coat protein [Bacillus licheniformis]